MESLKSNEVLNYRPNALQEIRKLYNLEQPGAMAEAVNILQEWVKKQNHFIKTDFDRSYLERTIIAAKGSIERAKQRLDKLCTTRTLLSSYFVDCRIKDLTGLEILEDAVLPRTTKDHYRVYVLRNRGENMVRNYKKTLGTRNYRNYAEETQEEVVQKVTDNEMSINMASQTLLEYLYRHDYAAGVVIVFDYRELNIMAMARKMDLVQLQQVMSIGMDCYGLRVKGIHMLSPSKVIDALVTIFKQALSAKVGSRIHVHKTLEAVHEHVEKDILPVEYGGTEKSLTEIHKLNVEALSSEEHMQYMKMMNAAGTNEKYRQTDKFNEQCLGMPGTFRTLKVD